MSLSSLRRLGPVAAVLASLAGPGAALAADPTPEHLAVARAVMDFSGVTAGHDKIVATLMAQARRNITQTQPELAADLDASIAAVTPEFESRTDKLINDIAKVYAANFTEAELKEIAAFYQSPVGSKFFKTLPTVMQQAMATSRTWTAQMSEDVMARLREEMKKRGHDI